MKNLYIRSTFRDIRQGVGRFIAIILIIFMGVLLFVGIKSVGPDLEATVASYIQEHKIADLQIQGTAGLTEEDQRLVASIEGAQVSLGYAFPYNESQADLDLQLYSYDPQQRQNQLTLVAGAYPTNDQEVLVDQTLAKTYPLGSQITLQHPQLKQQTYQVKGFVTSPIYVEEKERGVTTVGDGTLDGFLYLPKGAFTSEAYSIMYVGFSDLAQLDPATEAYQAGLIKKENQLTDLLTARKATRKQELTAQAENTLAENQQKLTENQQQLAKGQQALATATAQLEEQQQQLAAQKAQLAGAAGGQEAAQVAAAEAKLAEARATLAAQQQELTANQEKLTAAQEALEQGKADIAAIKTPQYIITERNSYPGFGEFTSLSDRIDAIGNVFPVFFFLIGILITFTTITRMVEEDRKEIGTLKALGYRNSEIAQKYLLYAFLTGAIGTVLGIVVGTKVLPPIVFSMLKKTFVFRDYPTNYWFWPIFLAVLAAMFATIAATLYILIKDLREKPMALLMPKAPKPGKRIILEYITPVWRRLSFNQKVTYRNLFRYKARMILTILGIAGCAGLMVAGFGLRDSIGGAADLQFNQLNHFQGIVSLADDVPATKATKVNDLLTQEQQVTDHLPIFTQQVTFKKEGVTDQSATVYALESPQRLKDYFTLKATRKDSVTTLPTTGAIITEGLAKAYDVNVGDTLTMQDNEGEQSRLQVAGVVENYLGNNVFVQESYFAKITQTASLANAILFKSHQMSSAKEETLAKKLQATQQVITTTFIQDQVAKQAYASDNLQPVVLIFIILSGTLAFVVLFNLTNINVSERERELATIKVLGFFDQEVTMYIVRENLIFTAIGILLGFGVGRVLTWFIITMAGSDNIAFPLLIPASGYLVSAVLTILFSVIVMLITHRKLKSIDMIGALKSNE